MLCDTYLKGKMESHASVTLKSETSSVLPRYFTKYNSTRTYHPLHNIVCVISFPQDGSINILNKL